MALRSRCIPLIGWKKNSLNGNMLPSRRDVLSYLFYLIRDEHKTAKESIPILSNRLIEVYTKFGIPTKRKDGIEKMIKRRLNQYNKIIKLKCGKAKKHFTDSLDVLFDISHANAIKTLQKNKNTKAINFLNEHRVSIEAVRSKLALEIEVQSSDPQAEPEACNFNAVVQSNEALVSHYDLDDQIDEPQTEEEDSIDISIPEDDFSLPKQKRQEATPKIDLVDARLTQVLDRYSISNRGALAVICQTAHNLGHDVKSLNISVEHIRKQRMKHRENIFGEIRNQFQANAVFTVHWDGKILEDCTNIKSLVCNRLAIIVSSGGDSKILGVPKVSRQTGAIEGDAVYSALADWNVQNNVMAMCFDTTASNTSTSIGACAVVEQKLGRQLIYLPCRHHIMELLAGAAFKVTVEKTSSGPKISLLEKFRRAWPQIQQDDFEYGTENADVAKFFPKDIRENIKDFIHDQITNKIDNTRHDYIEMLKLCALFIGENIPNYRISQPGAVSHARWMAKIIYCLKIFLFRKQFPTPSKLLENIRRYNIFVVRIYMRYWFLCQVPPKAPANDLRLLKELEDYKNVDAEIAAAVQNKLLHHLWYLNDANVALAFFDNAVSIDMKRKMVLNLKKIGYPDSPKRVNLNVETIMAFELCDFVNSNSYFFFDTVLNKEITKIDINFLKTDPYSWENNENYILAKDIVSKLLVVNDIAERGVALISRFNAVLTHQQQQKQFILHSMEQHYKNLPSNNLSKTKFIEYLKQNNSK